MQVRAEAKERVLESERRAQQAQQTTLELEQKYNQKAAWVLPGPERPKGLRGLLARAGCAHLEGTAGGHARTARHMGGARP
jgi:hypothetical protein